MGKDTCIRNQHNGSDEDTLEQLCNFGTQEINCKSDSWRRKALASEQLQRGFRASELTNKAKGVLISQNFDGSLAVQLQKKLHRRKSRSSETLTAGTGKSHLAETYDSLKDIARPEPKPLPEA